MCANKIATAVYPFGQVVKKVMWIFAPFMVLASHNAFAHDGTVNITGSILATSCSVEGGEDPMSIALGDYSGGTLTSVGQLTPQKTLTISLSNCSESISGTTVTVSGVADTVNNKLLGLNNPGATGTATGVGVQISDSSGNIININTASQLQPLTAGNNQISLKLAYEVTSVPVGPGDASSVMYLDFAYQ